MHIKLLICDVANLLVQATPTKGDPVVSGCNLAWVDGIYKIQLQIRMGGCRRRAGGLPAGGLRRPPISGKEPKTIVSGASWIPPHDLHGARGSVAPQPRRRRRGSAAAWFLDGGS